MKNRCVIPDCGNLLLTACIVCEQCLAKTRARLAEIPKLHAEAANWLEPGRSGRGATGNEPSIGVNVGALTFRQGADVLGTLWSWERVILEDTNRKNRELDEPLIHQGRAEVRIPQVCEFLLRQMPWIERQEWVDVFILEVAALYGTGMAVTGQTGSETRMICPGERPYDASTEQPELCGAILVFPTTADFLDIVQCRRCKTEWTKSRLIGVAINTEGTEVWLDAEAIATQLRMTADAVRKFAKRHDLRPRHGLYDLSAIMAKRNAPDQAKGA